MKIVSWNVNSVKARRERLLRWLSTHSPDVLCLQELKAEEGAFPLDDVYELGYRAALFGQKTYNGVAILARSEPEDVRRGLDDGEDGNDARLISARVGGLRVLSCYVPNGQDITSDKWPYKLRWLTRLHEYLKRHHQPEEPLLVCGDFNIAPEDRDCYDPEGWRDSVLCHEQVRALYRQLIEWGLCDSYRLHEQSPGKYSWWDYRMLAFPKGMGLRIDLLLVSRGLASRVTAVGIDREERKGKLPSDHAPVWVEVAE